MNKFAISGIAAVVIVAGVLGSQVLSRTIWTPAISQADMQESTQESVVSQQKAEILPPNACGRDHCYKMLVQAAVTQVGDTEQKAATITIAGANDDFKATIAPSLDSFPTPQILRNYETKQDTTDAQVINLFDGHPEIQIGQLAYLLRQQSACNGGFLQMDGGGGHPFGAAHRRNIAFVKDDKNLFHIVEFHCSSGGWEIESFPVDALKPFQFHQMDDSPSGLDRWFYYIVAP